MEDKKQPTPQEVKDEFWFEFLDAVKGTRNTEREKAAKHAEVEGIPVEVYAGDRVRSDYDVTDQAFWSWYVENKM